MKAPAHSRRPGIALIPIVLVSVIAGCGWAAGALKHNGPAGKPLSPDEQSVLSDCAKYMDQHDLAHYSSLARSLMSRGIWLHAAPDDRFLKASEQNGDTPYAYTLSGGKHPSAIVLAPRFFTESLTTASRASLMIHEMGHYEAYVATGKSDEYDGYKTQYDAAHKLGLSEKDGLIYFMMLDGVTQYVVPRDPSYGRKADVQEYVKESSQ